MSKIKETRTKLGMTQREVSNLLGIPRRTIEDWEAERRKCPDYVERLVIEKLVAITKRKDQKDVAEVRHGNWIVTDADDGMCEDYAGFIEFRCSECGFYDGFENGQYDWYYGDPITWKYCPMCGAKMNGERKEE